MSKQLRKLVDPFSYVPLEPPCEESFWAVMLTGVGYIAFALVFVGFIALVLGVL